MPGTPITNHQSHFVPTHLQLGPLVVLLLTLQEQRRERREFREGQSQITNYQSHFVPSHLQLGPLAVLLLTLAGARGCSLQRDLGLSLHNLIPSRLPVVTSTPMNVEPTRKDIEDRNQRVQSQAQLGSDKGESDCDDVDQCAISVLAIAARTKPEWISGSTCRRPAVAYHQ